MPEVELRPFGSRILVQRYDEQKISMIHVPKEAQKVGLRGTVIAIGPDCTEVDVGDDIFYGRFAWFELGLKNYNDLRKMKELDNGEIFIMNELDVLCHVVKSSQEDNDGDAA